MERCGHNTHVRVRVIRMRLGWICRIDGMGTWPQPIREVVAMPPPPGGCARGGGQWAGTHGPPRSVPARRVEEDNGTQ